MRFRLLKVVWLSFMLLVLALLSVNILAQQTTEKPSTDGGQIRTYYIAADEVDWDFAPHGDMAGMKMTNMEAMEAQSQVFLKHDHNRIGTVYRKAIYEQYTDDTFTTKVERAKEWEHLGILGPVIRAEVGDTIHVVFRNNASRAYSVHPHGVFYKKDAEGSGYNDGTGADDAGDDMVAPGATYTYIWEVRERSGPVGDATSIAWLYHSHVDEFQDTNAGLIGAIIIYKQGVLHADGTVEGIDREFVTLFKIFDENNSGYLPDNIHHFTDDDKLDPEDEDFHESNLKHSINGYVYGNLPGLVMNEGEHVRWYVLFLGNEVDIHTPHWHGLTGVWNGQNVDTISGFPGQSDVVDMIADDPGTWMFHCHVDDHMSAGMIALFTVLPKS